MARVQGDQQSWKEHTPGDGAACCPPQVASGKSVVSPSFSVLGGVSSVVATLAAGQCGVDEPLVATILPNPFAPPATLPILNSLTLVPGAPNLIQVDLDTMLADGDFFLELANDCGCCTIVAGTVSLA